MIKKKSFSGIDKVEKIASVSKFQRMLVNPFRYAHAILFREISYKNNKKEKEVICTTFFGSAMNILLPSSTDIYLTGGKSHDSEIRLAKFLIHNLEKGHSFIDIGAHYGYFSLLASTLVGKTGNITSFEASPTTFQILEKNKSRIENVSVYNNAVSDTDADLVFFEFPNLYSEYNTLDVSQFENEEWFKQNPPKKVSIPSVILDDFLNKKKLYPNIFKIDVEGAEFKVLNGAANYLKDNSPIIVIEYLSDERGNGEHMLAKDLLVSLGYHSHIIDKNGVLIKIDGINNYLNNNRLESDNIVFMKQKMIKKDIQLPDYN
ncbi:MAG: FkbM family methyltransferase [Maribacter sp.]|jgi:FkbM family methyltransferase